MAKISKTSKKSPKTPIEETSVDDGSVLAYLEKNPEFFVNHQDILGRLEIPHPCGEHTISLIERQVAVLRDQLRHKRERFDELMENARKNEALNQQLHKLTLQLIDCMSLDEIFSILHHRLTADFTADAVEIRIFLPPRCTGDETLKECSDWGGIVPDVIKPLLEASGEPVCVQNRVSQMACLFGERASSFGSGMLMPLRDKNDRIFGLLGIGSRDPKRFQHTLGTIFMSQLGEIVSHIISPYISEPSPTSEMSEASETSTPEMSEIQE
uniref:GAF domain-containing protein n=1 Tax=Candidatus Kentrum sp. MB TaxID=2138164 RepID=A0A451BC71_9GAMM|nr:MAG: hypothetical protein BECKMB1821I_GA0114274_102513 [Candidatus Kentron sp. MB]VFK75884.1 MAG: hypothetical protein BECKMB1821H_GA0114242_103425 [Candidatus Kentron sp. MB]